MLTFGLFICVAFAQFIPIPVSDVKEAQSSVWFHMRVAFEGLKEKVHGVRGDSEICNDVYVLQDPLPRLTEIPASYDLREAGLQSPVKDQGVCGSCWAFGTITLVEAAIMANRDAYFNAPQDPYFTQVLTEGAVQYLMNTSRSGVNGFCRGGNFIYAAFDYANNNTPTVELQSNYPYTSASLRSNPLTIIRQEPKLPREAYLNPFARAKIGRSCYTALIRIYDNVKRSFDKRAIQTIKSYIARGIPVVGAMYVGGGGIQSTTKFSNYKGGLFDEPCVTYGADHQIAFVGYGLYKGIEVWVIRNSWGEDWGDYGYFYVPIGHNTLCIENYAYTAIPSASHLANVVVGRSSVAARVKALLRTQLSDEDGLYVPPTDRYRYYDDKIIRGLNGLDFDDGSFTVISRQLTTTQIIWITVGAVGGIIVGVCAIILIVFRSKHQRPHEPSKTDKQQPQLQNIVG